MTKLKEKSLLFLFVNNSNSVIVKCSTNPIMYKLTVTSIKFNKLTH